MLLAEIDATYCALILLIAPTVVVLFLAVAWINRFCDKQNRSLGNAILLGLVVTGGTVAFNSVHPVPCQEDSDVAKAVNEMMDGPKSPSIAKVFPCPCSK